MFAWSKRAWGAMLWSFWWVLVIAITGANLVTRPWPDLSRLNRPPRDVRINPELPELEHRGRRARRGKHSFIYKWVSRQIDNGPGNSGNFRSSEQIVNGCPDLRYENIALWHHQWPCPPDCEAGDHQYTTFHIQTQWRRPHWTQHYQRHSLALSFYGDN